MLRKVFLVEDETVIREGLRDRIPWDQFGYRFVGEAADGEMALPLIRKTKPDVLITDIKMPFMDGLELSRLVKKALPDTKIIILSGYNEFDYAKEAIKIGISDYLLKPITSANLTEALKRRTFTGTFYRGQSIKDIMEIIHLSIPVRYKIDDHHVTISEI